MTPTIKYWPEDNAAYIRLSSADVLESEEVSPNVVFDFDAQGHIVGIELLDARSQLPHDALSGTHSSRSSATSRTSRSHRQPSIALMASITIRRFPSAFPGGISRA